MSKIFLFILLSFTLVSCFHERNRVKKNYNSTINSVNSIIKQDKNSIVTIKEVKIMAWWWHKQVVEKGIDGDNPPPKENYIEIKEWRYDGEGFTPYPKKMDFVSKIENKSQKIFKGIVRYNLKARFGNYRAITYGEYDEVLKSDDVECENYPLQNEGDVFEKEIYLDSGQSKVYKENDFEFTSLLRKEVNGNRICSLELNVEIFDLKGNKLDETKTNIPITLGD